jgi:hypothetical protein
VLGLVVLVCTALAASEYLTNRTGKTATAVTVTFSEEVRITSHDESVFPDQEPTGRAETFTFSGGELANGGRIKLSWTPGSAEISNVEWEATSAGAAAPKGGGVDWESVPVSVAYDGNADVTFQCDPAQALASARFWNRTGCRVAAFNAAVGDAGLAVSVALQESDRVGQYGYIVSFRTSPYLWSRTRLIVCLYPHDRQARLFAEVEGQYSELGTVSLGLADVTDRTVRAWIPSQMYEASFAAQTLATESTVDLQLECIEGETKEYYCYPGYGRPAWISSEGAVLTYEQVTGQSSGQNSEPLTYKQIMAQVAQYPGADEPLYVPAEGEQVWLTDLEGHADIYDNDSIKINYAPGFDKTQIKKIAVYRNGVRLWFVPAVFDVLTNEQMKTFDGNPTENTPKSSHTDHAIYGYEYELRFLDSEGVPAYRMLAVVSSPVSFSGRRAVNIGIAYDLLGQLSDAEFVGRLSAFRSLGFEAVQFGVCYFIESLDSNRIIPVYVMGTPMTPSWARTMTNDEIARLLRLIRQAGLESEIRIEVYLNSSYPEALGQWSGAITPSDVNAWFRNYSAVCVDLGRIAEAEDASVFYVAVEMDSMQRYASQWRAIAADTRAVFSGQISIVESTGTFLARENCYGDQFSSLVGQFWDAFDFIAVDHWPNRCLGLETQTDQRFSVVVERFANMWRRAFDYYRARYPGKRIEFGEFGTYNLDGVLANGRPDDMNAVATSSIYSQDLQEMGDAWAALLIGASAVSADGITVLAYWLVDQTGTGQGGHYLNNTPAWNVVKASLGGERAVATPSLAISPLFGFDWEQLPPVLSYSTTPNVWSSAFGPDGKAQYWGQPGCKVKAVKAAVYDNAVMVHVELYEPDLFLGHYLYTVTFTPWQSLVPESFCVNLDPGASSANVGIHVRGVWTGIWSSTNVWSSTGEEFAASDSTVSVVIRNELFSGYITPATLLRSSVHLQIYYVAADGEFFDFPSESNPPTDRSGQDFLVP